MAEARAEPNLGPGWDGEMGVWLDGVVKEFRGIGKHRGGLSDETTADLANWWGLSFSNKGIWIGKGVFGSVGAALSLPTQGLEMRKSLRWPRIESVEVWDSGRERINKLAVATFGILGIGAKKPLTNMMIRLPRESPIYFELDGSEPEWNVGLEPILRLVPAAAARLHFGQPVGTRDGSSEDVIGLLERLAGLMESGAITSEEFERKKQELLDRM